MRRPVRWLIASALFILLLAGCAPGAPFDPPSTGWVPPPTPTILRRATRQPTSTAGVFELRPTSTKIPTPTRLQAELLTGFGFGPGGFPPNINPLTGLEVSVPALLERRPMVIKITNFPRSVRPQWGLSLADHVYEYFLEDELTRFIAIYYGRDAGRVGPIRSGRPFDEHIVRAYKGVFAFAYADDRLMDLWVDSDITPFLVIEHDDNCPPMCRIGSENDYNTLYTNTALLTEYASTRSFSNTRQDLNGLHFEQHTFVTYGGGSAQRVETRFSPSSYHFWEYDPAIGRYLRWQESEREPIGSEVYEPLLDSLTSQQVGADNLVFLMVPMKYHFKSSSTEVFDIQFIGKGSGYALREGRIFAIQWNRPSAWSMLSLTFPGGSPYPLKPGTTFFEVLTDGSTHQVAGQTWRFQFEVPENLPVPTRTPKK
jgi:hypothetical protein